jgi:hypothetical protein
MKAPDSATEAIVQAPEKIEPIVQALEKIKPGISKDARSLADCLARLEPPKSAAMPPRADEVARFVQALGRGNISPASWYMIVMKAAEAGYYLPCSVASWPGSRTKRHQASGASATAARRRRSGT